MKIQYASDLHLEFIENHSYIKKNPIKPIGEILILAGDIIPFSQINICDDFFSYLSDHFRKTYWIPGNHEYYHYDISKKSGSFIESIKSNVLLLNNKSVIEDDIKLIFTTLWSKISPNNSFYIENSMNDFYAIKDANRKFTTQKYNDLHLESLNFLNDELGKSKKTIVITHHVPTFLNYPKKYKGDILNEAFATELFDFIATKKPNYWLYGHTHYNTTDFKIDDTKLITNQLGYVKYNEQNQYKSNAIITI